MRNKIVGLMAATGLIAGALAPTAGASVLGEACTMGQDSVGAYYTHEGERYDLVPNEAYFERCFGLDSATAARYVN